MKIGTKSLIFGIHQIFIHPIVVYRAWKYLYGRPTSKELICIIIHDWGYFGKPNLDGEEGTTHPEGGAKIANFLLGTEYRDLCLTHSRHYARKLGMIPSKLCWADKLSFAFESKKFYLFRARLSGEIKELRELANKEGFVRKEATNEEWFEVVLGFVKEMSETKTNGIFMHQE